MRKLNTKNRVETGSNVSIKHLASEVSSKYRGKTFTMGKRPFGVGILLCGYDHEKTPHVYELDPNGDCIEYEGYAIGSKS